MAKIDLKRARIDEKFEGDLDIDELIFHILFTLGGNKECDIYLEIEDDGGIGDEG